MLGVTDAPSSITNVYSGLLGGQWGAGLPSCIHGERGLLRAYMMITGTFCNHEVCSLAFSLQLNRTRNCSVRAL